MAKKEMNFWIKLENYFVLFNNIRSVSRANNGTKVSLINGEEFNVVIPFEKVQKMIEKP